MQPSLQLYVQDAVNENFTLAIGPATESITVLSDTFGVRTDSAAVSTVVDDQFVQNTPMNGRSFQSLIALAPGTVFISSTEGAGQFSVNGQRSDANYFTVDGVSANFGSASGCCLGQSMGGNVSAIWNGGYSHYEALQIQFQRRMSHGLQALASYNFAKTSDLGPNDGTGFEAPSISQVVLPPLSPSDFDIRHSVAGAVSYEVPASNWGRAGKAILTGWVLDGLVRVSSAPPIDVTAFNATALITFHQIQANVVPGQPYWIADPTQPSGRALNPAAFSLPVAGMMGDFPRNSLRSPYSIDQTDLALRRRFNLNDRLRLDLRAEYFNVFNHPMFGAPGFNQPNTEFGITSFGKISPTTTNEALGAGVGGSQNALYAAGGPRSAQFTLKLLF